MAEKKIKIPQYEIEALARCFLPDILAFYESNKDQKVLDEQNPNNNTIYLNKKKNVENGRKMWYNVIK